LISGAAAAARINPAPPCKQGIPLLWHAHRLPEQSPLQTAHLSILAVLACLPLPQVSPEDALLFQQLQAADAGAAAGVGPTSSEQSSQAVPALPAGAPGGAAHGASEVVLDWKGEPMTINPGDKLPFKFL
jgi:hypothetical protein